MPEEKLNAAQLVRVYTKIRDRRRELEAQVEALKEQQDTIAAHMLDICKDQDASTIRTEFGTISRRTKKHFWTSDWESFYKFVKQHDAFSLLQQRINDGNMKEFLESNPEMVPPGLNADIQQTVVVTKNRS